MILKDTICPHCGNKIKIDIEKETNFCFQCGGKIISEKAYSEEKPEIDLEEKLEEVGFYFQLSRQKREALDQVQNPRYYLKAQDMLLDLSNVFKKDYRVWWELSKPLDYAYEEEVQDGQGLYRFNEEYFNKALDLASIAEKKQLILAVDEYEKKKTAIRLAYESKEAERRREEEKAQAEEERKRKEVEQKKREEEIKRQEAERQRLLQEQMRQKENERILQERILKENEQLYLQFMKKDYSMLDCMYFTFSLSTQKEYTVTLTNIANVLYLTAFYKEGGKNVIYKEQSQAVYIGAKGEVIKYDNQYLRIKGVEQILRISSDGYGGLSIVNWKLYKNMDFVKTVMKNAKKPLLSLNKIFV